MKSLKKPAVILSFLVLGTLLFCAIFANQLMPYDPFLSGTDYLAAPGSQYLLGTDRLGRDILSRVIYGARISLSAGFFTTAISTVIGVTVGMLGGYFEKAVDSALMRITDIVMSFPTLMLILVVISILGRSLRNIILVLAFLGWPPLARVVRGNVLAIKQKDYIVACRVMGYSAPRIMLMHILPNILQPILVSATFDIARNILLESSLSFLGASVPMPTPSWGNMLSDIGSLTMLVRCPWLWLAPGLAILCCILATNVIGNAFLNVIDRSQKYI
jgi:peptide/nickel transport system permease protein